MKRVIITSLLVFITISLSVFSIVPRHISWQGLLTDDKGEPLNGMHTITMRLYDTDNPMVGTPIWAETVNVNIEDGLANIIMGDIMPLPTFDIPYWLEIMINAGPALPRVKLASTPYSLMSKDVEDNSISTPKLKQFSVTNDKILSVDWTKITNAPTSFPPTGPAGGDLSGNYPNPLLKDSVVTSNKIAKSTVIRSLNDLTDEVNIVAGSNISIHPHTPGPNDITISSYLSGPAGGDLDGFYPNPIIRNGAVTYSKLAPNSVGTIHIIDESITTDKIADDAITGRKIADNTVVRSIGKEEYLRDHVTLVEGANIRIDENYQTNEIKITSIIPDVIVMQDDDGNKTEISASKIKQTKSGSISTTIIQLGTGFYADENGNTTTIDPKGVTISDDDGNETRSNSKGTKTSDKDGNSSETTAKGTRHQDPEGNSTETTAGGTKIEKNDYINDKKHTNTSDAESSTIRTEDSDGNLVNESEMTDSDLTFRDGDGNEVKIGIDGISMKDSSGAPVFEIKKDGSSYHKGKEVFAGGAEFPGDSTKPDTVSIGNGQIKIASPITGDTKTITSAGNLHTNIYGNFNNATPVGNIIGDSQNNTNSSNSSGNTITNADGETSRTTASEAEFTNWFGRKTKTTAEGVTVQDINGNFTKLESDQIVIESDSPTLDIHKQNGTVVMYLNAEGNLNVNQVSTQGVNIDLPTMGPLVLPALRVKTNEGEKLKLDHEGFNVSEQTFFHEYVGIGTNAPMEILQVGKIGDGTRAVANSWEEFSDINLKMKLTKLSGAISMLNNLNAYFYFWKNGADKSRQFGLIAQEVEEVLPEIVTNNKFGYKTLNYAKISALLVEAVKEQQELIIQLTEQIDDLKLQVNQIEILKQQNRELADEIGQIKSILNDLHKKYLETPDNTVNNYNR